MKGLWRFVCVALFTGMTIGAEPIQPIEPRAPRLTTVYLMDQFNQPQSLVFPQPAISVLTVADRKGSEQITAWVKSLKERLSQGIRIRGVADVSTVPRVLRPFVRKRFAEKFKHPVMLDWEGRLVGQLNPRRRVANVYLLGTNGVVLLALSGEVTTSALEQLAAVIDNNIPSSATTNSISAVTRDSNSPGTGSVPVGKEP
jgi:hypothetical protein